MLRVCVFVCFSTKAVHLELVMDLTTKAFLAALRRFSSRRGYPSVVYSDNGTHFVGAAAELEKARAFLLLESTQKEIQDFALGQGIRWVFSPSRAPHFGGLWEAAVRSMKTLLRKVVGGYCLYQHELQTIPTEIEGTLNSRPLAIIPGAPEEGVLALTAGHFLIGRPIRAPPVEVDTTAKIDNLRSWNLVERLTAELWVRWRREYLQQLQRRTKWRTTAKDIQVGDIVLLKETDWWQRSWPLARVEKTFVGNDGHVRVVDIFLNQKTYRRPVHKLVPLVTDEEGVISSSSRPPEDVRAT